MAAEQIRTIPVMRKGASTPINTLVDVKEQQESVYETVSGESDDPYDPDFTDPEIQSNLYPPLTSVKETAAAVPSVQEISQPAAAAATARARLTPTALPHPVSAEPPIGFSEKTPESHVMKYKTLAERCREEAARKGDLTMLMAMPVIYRPNHPPEYQYLTYEMIKEVQNAVRDYGLHSNYTSNLITVIGESYTMTPRDWKSLLRIILMPAQYSVWLAEYQEAATVQTVDNFENVEAGGLDEYLGINRYATPEAQAGLSRQRLQQISPLALKCLKRVPEAGKRQPSFTVVRQGAQEPYVTFIGHLQTALSRQIDDENAVEMLLLHVAYENANADCKKILAPLRNSSKSIAEFIKACQNIGSEEHRATLLASALAQQLVVGQAEVKCFECNQMGHIRKNCPKLTVKKKDEQKGSKGPKKPKELCPKCKKGYHWSNQCRSKFDKDGNPVQGTGRGAQGPVPPNTTGSCAHAQYLQQQSHNCCCQHAMT
ncbi:endogenous retrovirus group K member 8 Gag polyprotein-like [Nyctibius grandis]|uniref:endogenous retrovirus group K member 8 Gag polyprotein-like n=1 Tax=Nyctibius grandis TaxID=48427 RepID=UPI0035BBFC04